MQQVNASDVKQAMHLMKPNSEQARAVEQSADLVNLLVGVINASLAAVEGKGAAALGIVDKHAVVAGFVGKQENAKNLVLASTTVQISTQTLALLKLGSNASPAVLVTTLGAMFTKKVSLAFGLVENDKQAKLLEVSTDCASSVFSLGGAIAAMVTTGAGTAGAVGAVGAVTAAGVTLTLTPVGLVLLGAALAQVGASAYQAYALKQQE